MIIDVEHHFTMRREGEDKKFSSGKICERFWDEKGNIRIRVSSEASFADRHLEFMDAAGIDMAMLTINPEMDLEQCKHWNDFCAETVREHPNRFIGFASVPPLEGEPAFNELERAVKDLGLKGVHVFSRVGKHTLDSRELWPFYEKVDELKIPIDVHISSVPDGFDALQAPYALYYVMAREFDISATTLKICLGGVLEDFPDMVFIINHLGGGVSAVMERLDAYLSYVGPGWPDFYYGKPLISKPWREYFNKLYFNMAGREYGMESLKCALTNINPKRLLFGTDWPFNFDGNPQGVREFVEEIKGLDLPRKDIDAMLGGNAARLLGIDQPAD